MVPHFLKSALKCQIRWFQRERCRRSVRQWKEKRNINFDGFVVRYKKNNVIIHIEETSWHVIIGILPENPNQNKTPLTQYILSSAKKYLEKRVQVYGKREINEKDFITQKKRKDFLRSLWMPVAKGRWDKDGKLIAVAAGGDGANIASSVHAQTDGIGIRFVLFKELQGHSKNPQDRFREKDETEKVKPEGKAEEVFKKALEDPKNISAVKKNLIEVIKMNSSKWSDDASFVLLTVLNALDMNYTDTKEILALVEQHIKTLKFEEWTKKNWEEYSKYSSLVDEFTAASKRWHMFGKWCVLEEMYEKAVELEKEGNKEKANKMYLYIAGQAQEIINKWPETPLAEMSKKYIEKANKVMK